MTQPKHLRSMKNCEEQTGIEKLERHPLPNGSGPVSHESSLWGLDACVGCSGFTEGVVGNVQPSSACFRRYSLRSFWYCSGAGNDSAFGSVESNKR